MDTAARSSSAGGTPHAARWVQLVLGIICMAMIANLQYGWTLFVVPIHDRLHFGKSDIQVAFAIFFLAETWLVPVEGYLVDRLGPALVTVCGGILVAVAWTMNSFASSLSDFYIAAAIGGIGAGAVYVTCIGNALKWFPDHRGLAAGLTAMAFGTISALTIVPIASMIESKGYEQTFLYFGLGLGMVVFLLGWLLRAPSPRVLAALPRGQVLASRRNYRWQEMLQTPIFWLMYVMFVLMAAGGVMAAAQLGPIATDFKLADIDVTILGLTFPALTFALSIQSILKGVACPFFGWVSDRLGRENTMCLAFLLEAAAIYLLGHFGTNPLAFVLLTGLVFFAWGEIDSLFPSTCGDTFGPKFATTNVGLLYTAKGTASVLVPFSSILVAPGWRPVLLTAVCLNVSAAAIALLILKPLRRRWTAARDREAHDLGDVGLTRTAAQPQPGK